MFQKDFFLRLVEEFFKVLARIARLREEGKPEQAMDLIQDTMEDYFKFNSLYIYSLSKEDCIRELIEEKGLQEEELAVLADLLKAEGEVFIQQDQFDKSREPLEKALLILQYLEDMSKTVFSFERVGKIKQLKELLGVY